MKNLRRGTAGWWMLHAATIAAFFLLGMFTSF
jgi:hypothetical protein